MKLRPSQFSSVLAQTEIALIQTRCSSTFDIYGNSPIPANKQKFVPSSGTYPKGFRVGSIHVGIKPASKSQPDLVLVASEKPSNAAAVFTKNEFAAPSITVSREIIKKTKGRGVRGVIANSWCANLFNGKEGLENSLKMSMEANKYVSGDASKECSSVMVMHTGKARERLPMDNIIRSLPQLHFSSGNSHEHWLEAAKGLITTDTFPKLVSRTFTVPSSNTTYSMAGLTKGSGMIHPNMATTLGIICTDAPISAPALQQLLSTATEKSYNCISVDGDTSTNDMLAMLANGAAGGTEIEFDPSAISQSQDFVSFQRTLIDFMADMAKLVVRDGEGAMTFITIRVRGAPTYPAGKHIASVIARSVLFKTGIYGKDPSWGNVMVALGQSLMNTEFARQGIIVRELTSVSFVPSDGGEGLRFVDKGEPIEVDEERVKEVMEEEDVEIVVDMRDDGKERKSEEAVYWTCDLTHEFVTMNSDFRT